MKSIEEQKRELRAKLKAMPVPQVDENAVADAVCALEEYKKAKTVFAFISVKGEPPTRAFIDRAIADGKTVTVPKCYAGGIMEARRIESFEDLIPGMYSIPEPGENTPPVERNEIDFALVPAHCFDEQGGRLGKGGGYYDRFLENFSGVKVGLCFADRVLPKVPMDSWDISADVVVAV